VDSKKVRQIASKCYKQFIHSVYTELMVFVNTAHCIQTNITSRTLKLNHYIIKKDKRAIPLLPLCPFVTFNMESFISNMNTVVTGYQRVNLTLAVPCIIIQFK
jgi:hypothetical protein